MSAAHHRWDCRHRSRVSEVPENLALCSSDMLVSPPLRRTAGARAKKRPPADLAGAPKFPLKAIHNELPAAAHGEGRNANCPRATFVAGAGPPGYWNPAQLACFSPPVWQQIQYVSGLAAVKCSRCVPKCRRGIAASRSAGIRIIYIMERNGRLSRMREDQSSGTRPATMRIPS